MQSLETVNIILFIIMAALGIIAIFLTMGYMVYGEEEEE